MFLAVLSILLGLSCRTRGFSPTSRGQVFGIRPSSALEAYSTKDLAEIGFRLSVSKPLGVIFGENKRPFLGLVVDDVEPGLNGGKAGIRSGDQLLAINDSPVVGEEFDSVMDMLRQAEGTLEVILFRGPSVEALYGILESQDALPSDDEAEEVVVMDENYESPVQIDLSEFDDKPLSLGDVFNAAKKVGSMLTEDVGPPKEEKKTEKKSGGFLGGIFGGGEAIQLEGDDAAGLQGVPLEARKIEEEDE